MTIFKKFSIKMLLKKANYNKKMKKKPFIFNKLELLGLATTIKAAKKKVTMVFRSASITSVRLFPDCGCRRNTISYLPVATPVRFRLTSITTRR